MSDGASVIAFRPAKPKAPPRPKTRARRLIAVGGGKGGIGKSLLSANLGIALAKRGAKVVLFDADLGGANLHTCLGVNQPPLSLSDFIDKKVEALGDVAVETGVSGLKLISGARDVLDAANPKHAEKQKLMRHVRALDVDFVVIDLGAGTSFNVLDFFVLADLGLVVLLPEPTSIENGYRFIKAAFFRRLQNVGDELGVGDVITGALAGKNAAPRTPFELIEKVRQVRPEVVGRLELAIREFRPHLVVNQARTRDDHDIGLSVVSAWKKFFGLDLGYLGAVAHDDAVWRSVRARQSVLVQQPQSIAAMHLQRVAENLMAVT